jgi:Tfp pilus assembly protein PilF
MKKGDAKFAKHDWAGAIIEYQKCAGSLDNPNMPGMNRLILAYLNAGRIKDADGQIGTMIRYKKADEVTRALQGMLYIKQHQAAKARELVQEGVDNSILPSMLIAAYADLSMGQVRKARSVAEKAVLVAPDRADVQLLRGYVMPDAIDADKAVIKALQIDPTIPEAYSLRGFQTMLGRGTKRFVAADQLFDFALKRDPINNYALMGGALSLLAQKRYQEAESSVMQLARQDPYAPDTHFLVALYYSEADKSAKIQTELETGRKLDPDKWQDALVPTPQDLIARVYRYRYQPVVTPDSLYPEK